MLGVRAKVMVGTAVTVKKYQLNIIMNTFSTALKNS